MEKEVSGGKNKGVRGGRRPGAGRPCGSGRYGEPTTLMRIPNSMAPSLSVFLEGCTRENLLASNDGGDAYGFDSTIESVSKVSEMRHWISCQIPLYESRVAAGSPAPATEYEEGKVDLNSLLVPRPVSTFLVRVQGDSMVNAGINPGDLLIVDRSLQATHGRIVVAMVDGELTVKRLLKEKEKVTLHPENPVFKPIEIQEHQDFRVWGVVTNVVRDLR